MDIPNRFNLRFSFYYKLQKEFLWAPWKPHEKFNHSVSCISLMCNGTVLSSHPASTLTQNINIFHDGLILTFWISRSVFTDLTCFWTDLIILGWFQHFQFIRLFTDLIRFWTDLIILVILRCLGWVILGDLDIPNRFNLKFSF